MHRTVLITNIRNKILKEITSHEETVFIENSKKIFSSLKTILIT